MRSSDQAVVAKTSARGKLTLPSIEFIKSFVVESQTLTRKEKRRGFRTILTFRPSTRMISTVRGFVDAGGFGAQDVRRRQIGLDSAIKKHAPPLSS
jgi:hypothetical protein